jgi:glyoxalase-like protein
MPCELDHIIVWTELGAPEAEMLLKFGFTEGTSNTHPGQGTANRRFFFHNAYLELLWVHDREEAKSNEALPARLLERWSGRARGSCPFGFCFRPEGETLSRAPFSAWEYRPPYLPDPHCILVGTNIDNLIEPMLFYLDLARRPDELPQAQRQRLEHAAGVEEITRVRLVSPHGDRLSLELQAVADSGLLSFGTGKEFLMEIRFDNGEEGQEADLRPALPLIFHW